MNKLTTSTAIPTRALKLEALSNISASFELFCLASGMEALGEMMDHDAQAICGPRHARGRDRQAHRWGKTKGRIGFHGGKVEIERPRLRGFDGKEQPIPSWEAAVAEDWLGKWCVIGLSYSLSGCLEASRLRRRCVQRFKVDAPSSRGETPKPCPWTASRHCVVSADVELRSRQAESGRSSSIFTETSFIWVSRSGSAETSSADHTVA